ncbi:uncharacterized protein JCM15063_003766 [Sporobolomyces koalae]|uniref:uncharacterized protein n=1 Tax=Sporobolomyces koalae TaxID=500713 RepID=UPI00316F4DEF
MLPGPPPVAAAAKETKAAKQRMSLAPLAMDFAYNRSTETVGSVVETVQRSPASRPRSLRSAVTSPRKTAHYRHHEAAPRKLIRKLNSLLHGNLQRKQSKRRDGFKSPFNGSAPSLTRGNSVMSTTSALSRTPLSGTSPRCATAEPESMTSPAAMESQRPSIKIRLATFNMHDTLPTSGGDFSDWLGDVSNCPNQTKKRKRSSMSSRNSTMTLLTDKVLPKFPLNAEHPYHVIVVASQECPTASGVLAGRVRTLDGRGWTNMLENYLCGGSSYESESESEFGSSDSESDGAPGERQADRQVPKRPPPVSAPSISLGSSLPPNSPALRDSEAFVSSRAPSIHGSISGDNRRRKGPYVLVEKERLMGIYIAVFVARSCEDLIGGVSKSRVPAGLIGGRLGNKGGVAVSLHLANSRLLFVSAHLAAHASAIEIRKANVLKILEEIAVDDFWQTSGKLGPKPKNLSDRFDQAFFLGDLNFRLNITRLHSDWLIARKDYSTALQFDQLRDVLGEKNSVFSGFAEGDIHFAPTYKYDVVHRVKKKRSALIGGRSKKGSREGGVVPISEPNPTDEESRGSVSDPEVLSGTSKPGDEDTVSIVSSVGTISTLDDLEQFEREDLDKSDLTSLGLPTPPKKGAETHMDAVRNAQVRFLTLVKTNSATAALQYAARKRSSSLMPKSAPPLKTMFAQPRPILQTSQSAVVVPMTWSTSAPLGVIPANSGSTSDKSDATMDGEGEVGPLRALKQKLESFIPEVEPVFDSSSKQRVQSYTDRILFKSTIEPPEEDEEEDEEEEPIEYDARALQPSRSTAFVNALRDFTHSPLGHDSPQSRRGSAEDRHLRFGDLFNRRRSVSSDTAADFDESVTKQSIPRTKSLQPGQLRRQHSGSPSVGTDETDSNRKKAFWRRVASFPALSSAATSAPSSPKMAPTPTVTSPLASPAMSIAPDSPTRDTPTVTEPTSYFSKATPSASVASTPTRRGPRKMFTLSSNSPPSSPEDDRPQNSHAVVNFLDSPSPIETPPLPRAASDFAAAPSTQNRVAHSPKRSSSSNAGLFRHASVAHRPSRSVSGSAVPAHHSSVTFSDAPMAPSSSVTQARDSSTAGQPHQISSTSLNTRFKSFLNSIPLPFLSAPSPSRGVDPNALSASLAAERRKRKKKHGPRPGEIQVVEYDSVPNLAKMGAVSDHRPVYLVCAIGVEESKPREQIDHDDEDE